MKKTAYALIIIFIFSLLPIHTPCADASSSSTVPRFEFIEVDYDGEIYDLCQMSDSMFMVCGKDHKSGFIDDAGKVAINFDFAYAGSFSDSLAPANIAYGKLGYIDKSGKFAIEPQFDEAYEFSCGLALVRKGSKTGFIDKSGKFVNILKSDEYTPISSFSDGLCWVEDENDKRAIMNISGEILSDFDFVWSGEWSEGVCWASKDMGSDFNHINMGLIDLSGNFLIEPGIYTDASTFNDGVCWARKKDSDKIFLINNEGDELASVSSYLMPSDFCSGFCVNAGSDLLSIMNTDGTIVYNSNKYRSFHYGGFREGKMLVERLSDKKYFIMSDLSYTSPDEEEEIPQFEYEQIQEQNNDFEIALMLNSPKALINGKQTLIDENDERVFAFTSNGRTLLPMRFIAENLPGYSVTWDYISSSALVQSAQISILLAPDTQNAQVIRYLPEQRMYEQKLQILDQPPVNAYDRLFLPVRALCEMIGANVFYDERGLVVVSSTRTSLDYTDATAMIDTLTN